jgi:hypothetical protein
MNPIGKDMMKTLIKILGVVLIIGILAAGGLYFIASQADGYWVCNQQGIWVKQGNPSHPKPTVSCTDRKPLAKNQADCLAQDGVWQKQGPEPFETCNRKATDRGNLCRDNAECEGMCQVDLTRDEISQGMRGKLNIKKKYGQCSVWVVELGCYGMMKQGKAQVICID